MPVSQENQSLYGEGSIATAESPSTSVTYGGQTALPPLPIPSLDETLSKFLRNLEPLHQHDKERTEAQRIVEEFSKDDGPALQNLLLKYDREGRESGVIGSYVEEFWNDSYLAPDSSVVLNLNPFFVLEDSPDPKISKDPIQRAASLCFASIKLASSLRDEKLKPDMHRGKSLCMDQFKALFATSRVPQHSRDTINVFEKSNHVAVMCCSQLYYFQALWPDGACAVDEFDLVDILNAIRSHAKKMDPVQASRQAVGVLTSLPRKEWALAREEMIQYSQNKEALQIVDSALFVLVLDDYIPQNKHDAAANMLHGSYELQTSDFSDYQVGSCCNRWYDKLQIIVCGDGTAGINFEHSAIDGHTALRFVSDVYAETVITFAQSITKLVQAHDLIPNVIEAKVKRAATTLDPSGRTTLDVFPKKVCLDLPESIERRIYFAETALGDQIVASELRVLEFNDYGKKFITGNKLSPDSYVQMSMMLAYYKLYGRMVCAYEPVLTKAFYHGRTEAMRPATAEAKHFCEVFCSSRSCTEEKERALRNATMVHSQLVKECAKGRGVDRHLFALKCIAEKYNVDVPPFFRSMAWKVLNHTILSTSNCGNPSLALFGFGPVVPDGLGIGYIIKDTCIHYSISSKHRQTTRFALTLESVLKDMAKLLQPISSTQVSETRTGLKDAQVLKIAYDSYGDFWGESTPPTSPRRGYPKVAQTLKEKSNGSDQDKNGGILIPESGNTMLHEMDEEAVKRRWVAEAVESDFEVEVDVKFSDDGGNQEPESQANPPNLKRRGSNDLTPVVPARRSSMFSAAARQPSLEYKELSQKGTSIEMKSSQEM